jgi:hypothetical protein
MSEHMLDQLSDYLDDELDSVAGAAVARHLAECQACAETLEQLRAVRTWAPGYSGLPTSRDLWPQVKRGIGTRARTTLPWHGRRVTIGMPLLLAASVILVLLSATVVTLMRRGPADTVDSTSVVIRKHGKWDYQKAGLTDQQYDTAVAQMEQLLATRDSVLEPGTLQVIRQSLMKIDKAIDDARQAIARDSNNAFLRASIAANMRRKLDLLRTAAQAVTAKS